LIIYVGKQAIALLGSGDQTQFNLNYHMPTGFAYLLRNHMVRYNADDNDLNFTDTGFISYYLGRLEIAEWPQYPLLSPGTIAASPAAAEKIYMVSPQTPKLLLLGGDRLHSRLVDPSTGGSVAGDMYWYSEFYVFDVDQIDKWEINTPIPTISHTSF